MKEQFISRTAHCKNCEKNGHPKQGQQYIVFGSSCGEFHAKRAKNDGHKGYTPFLLRLNYIAGNTVYYSFCCSICEIAIDQPDEMNISKFSIKKWHHTATSLKNWESWIRFKDFAYYI